MGETGDNEQLVLHGMGCCPYCGQLVAIEPEPGESAQEAAARVCGCADAKRARRRAERIERSREMIGQMFGEGCAELYGTRPIPEEAVKMLETTAVMVLDGVISSCAMQIGHICRAAMGVGGKGELKIKRVESRSYAEEE